MKETLSHVQTSSLRKASEGITEVLKDLKEALGEARFKNDFYIQLLKISTPIDWEYFEREKAREDILC